MKFANIDDAIMEAAKKPAPAKPAPKAAAKKVEPKKAPAAPAKPAAKVAPKKAEPKKVEAPAPKKKAVAPAPAAPKKAEPKKAEPKKKPAAAKPEKKAEPKKEPEKSVQPWSTKGREARSKELASMSSQEREKESEASKRKMGLRPASRGIGDRLKSAWKAFTAKPGSSVDIKKSYKSVFHEIQKLMEQLQLVEAMLQEQSLNESYDATTVNTLHERRDAIRSVLTEQIVREELYKHNVTIAELDQRQRAALMETVTLRANALWEGLNELSPELMGRYMDKAKSQVSQNIDKVGYNKQYHGGSGFNQAQRAAKDTKRIQGMTTALGSMDKKLQQRYNNPQGTTDVQKAADQKSTVDKFDRAADNLSRAKEYSKMAAESYTLEEWMGMMNELSPETLARAASARRAQASQQHQKSVELTRQAGQHTEEPGTINAPMRQTMKAASAAEKARDNLAARADRLMAHRRSKNPNAPAASREPADVAPAMSPATKRTTGLSAESYTLEEWMGMVKEAGYALHKKEK